MKYFVPTSNKNYSFSSCDSCEAKCCNGSYGTLFSQIILEDFTNFENFPILFTFGNLDFAKPVIMLTNGTNFCRYLKAMKCSIYDKRPQVCKNYPLSPNLDEEVYIDLSCPSVKETEEKSDFIKINKQNDYFKNYKELYLNTYFEFEKYKKEDFQKLFTLRDIDFYGYLKDDENQFIKMHQKSLVHLKDDYFKKVL